MAEVGIERKIADALSSEMKFAITGCVRRVHGSLLLTQGTSRTLLALERRGLTRAVSELTDLGVAVRNLLGAQSNG